MQSLFSECDDTNRPPSLNILTRTIHQLTYSGSDIRGRFVDHARLGSIASVAHELGRIASGTQPPLTPLAAFCFGNAFARMLRRESPDNDKIITIVIGRDPREHGTRLADSFGRGCQSADPNVRILYTGIATTPACAAFPRLFDVHAGVMVTASHLPKDRNGFKIYTRQGGYNSTAIKELGILAAEYASEWYSKGILPPSSGKDAVMCDEWVHYMDRYADSLIDAVKREVGSELPLKSLKIVFNAGNGSGGFFKNVLESLGAQVFAMHCEPDAEFPNGVPNPEYKAMIDETTKACQESHADLGIMLDTDADRCGFVAPRTIGNDGTKSDYEPLNRNRLIALLGVIMASQSPGCAIVTDSVTSEGLSDFLQGNLGLEHVRYIKGYANVINKAKELTESGQKNVEVAIETSGHCAMQENGYLDDGTYTAVKVVSLLAKSDRSLLDLIVDMKEMDEISELRMETNNGSLDTMKVIFDFCALEIERASAMHSDIATKTWKIDTDNLEGIRVRIGDGQFFLLRKSLHDPIISLQIEAVSKDVARDMIVLPLIRLFRDEKQIENGLNLVSLQNF